MLSVVFFVLYCLNIICLLYTSPSPRDRTRSRMPSSACKKKNNLQSYTHFGSMLST
ncbi:hypothetical protein PVA38_06145 [Streptococcus pneumoniae D39]|nr:hypothetical protein PVA38_06145 [Streptococcus pneumoniae D39]